MRIIQKFYKHLLLLVGIIPLGYYPMAAQASLCPEAALAQVVDHRIGAGETLSTVAAQYGLLPATLTAMNPNLSSQGVLPVGQVIEIPPFNGRVVQVGAGQTWQSLAESHGTRADLLFEVNGCPKDLPNRVFIPGSNRTIIATAAASTDLVYPLPNFTRLVLNYGWQPHPQRDELVFNSGIALAATPGTVVMAAAEGIVAFVGETNGALMVVVNHRNGLQTRYGNLLQTDFAVGDAVSEGTNLGTVAGSASESFLYFEVRTNSAEGWVARDPGQYLAELDVQR
ncbi:LysM peptidoglycan-binding domain-containing M23 family metallopeptidase [Leptothoe sp. PORK10 BA2]|uniref:LysM peptidoglycan-binding domain-containing M23 family metallopeptidase n=1 Tax=Leptothoe sp. PORK10 BA2 TaxID=3110254 RepID=UPI002B220D56|nr:M23 family metallopeptidase [Leptothoe sp. PORK10 BA2]MEA5466328.1 M23 family metallopeptidase [Leptothoe sp. PORK10 BA2]